MTQFNLKSLNELNKMLINLILLGFGFIKVKMI